MSGVAVLPVPDPGAASPGAGRDGTAATCAVCAEDLDFLVGGTRPAYETLPNPIRIVDLFCGGGSLSPR